MNDKKFLTLFQTNTARGNLLSVNVFDATEHGIRAALCHAKKGNKSYLMIFNGEPPTSAQNLISICQEKYRQKSYKEITVS